MLLLLLGLEVRLRLLLLLSLVAHSCLGFLLHAAALVLLAPGGLLLLCALSTLLVGDVEARAAAFALYGFGSSHCW